MGREPGTADRGKCYKRPPRALKTDQDRPGPTLTGFPVLPSAGSSRLRLPGCTPPAHTPATRCSAAQLGERRPRWTPGARWTQRSSVSATRGRAESTRGTKPPTTLASQNGRTRSTTITGAGCHHPAHGTEPQTPQRAHDSLDSNRGRSVSDGVASRRPRAHARVLRTGFLETRTLARSGQHGICCADTTPHHTRGRPHCVD